MLIRFVGDDPDFLINAFELDETGDNLRDVSSSSTRIVGENTLTGYRFVINGSFDFDDDGFITEGIITGLTLSRNGTQQLVATGFSINLIDAFNELDTNTPDLDAALDALGLSSGVTIDAGTAQVGLDLLAALGSDPSLDLGLDLENSGLNIPVTYIGSSFDDGLVGLAGADSIAARSGNDTILSFEGNDTIKGGNGRDLIEAGTGRDDVSGDGGNDTILGESGQDTIKGGSGADSVSGGTGDDLLRGGNGNDMISGGLGDDTLKGENNRDRLDGDAGDDIVEGGRGNDVVQGGAGKDTLKGGSGNDRLEGQAGNDRASGGSGNDMIKGGNGRDRLEGGSGEDTLEGGRGNDLLRGGAGDDTLTGNGGSDTFDFVATGDTDLVTDFELGVDSLSISAALAGDLDAQGIEDAAIVADDALLIRLSGDSTIILDGISTSDGLAAAITIEG